MLNSPEPAPSRHLKIALMGASACVRKQLANAIQQTLANKLAGDDAVLLTPDPELQAVLDAHIGAQDPLGLDAVLNSHRVFDLTLVCGMDEHSEVSPKYDKKAFDAKLRILLQHKGLAFAVIYGEEHERLASALRSIAALKNTTKRIGQKDQAHWHWTCDNCSDPGCEQRLFTGRLKIKADGTGLL